MFLSDQRALDAAVVALRDAVRLADMASLPLPEIKHRLDQVRSLKAALDLYTGRLAAQAQLLHGREGAAAAAGMSKKETERLTAITVESLPLLEDAVLDGSLSSADTTLIAGASEKDPTAAARLVDLARNKHEDLRGECLNVRKNAETDAARARRHHRNRSFRSWTGDDGETCARFALPPEVAAPIIKAISEEAARLMKARTGELEA